jgi:hypothetical protein
MASSDNQSGASRSSGTTGSSSSTLQSATSAVSDIAHQAGDRVRDQASRAASQVQEQSQAFLSEQKEVAADHIEGVARVLHDTVDQLRQRSPGVVTDYAERAVQSLDSFANSLRDRDVRDLVTQVEDFARRQPVIFLAGSVAVGFALARFLKSSSQRSSYGQGSGRSVMRDQDYGDSSYRSGTSRGHASDQGTEYARHMATETAGISTNAMGGAPAMGSSDGPASPQYSTTRSGSTGGSRRSGKESG